MIKLTLSAIVALFVWIFVIGPLLEQGFSDVLDKLGQDSICPKEFTASNYSICFNAEGDVIVNGRLTEQITVQIDGTNDACHIKRGYYDFEYSGCRLDKFKNLEAHNILLITSGGRVSLSGKNLLGKISAGSEILKISPKGVRWLRQLLPFVRFLGF